MLGDMLVTDDKSPFQNKQFVANLFKRAEEARERRMSMKDMQECVHGDAVVYTGASDTQVNWGGNDDPRPILEEDQEYLIDYVEVHSWHTKVKLIGIQGLFNSVSFTPRS